MSVADFVHTIVTAPSFQDILCEHRILPLTPAQYGTNKLRWSKPIVDLLQNRNIKLYTHQTLATDHIRAGHAVVVSTPTASGKSLIYNLPVLEQFLKDKESRALYLFPLKALAQDQLQSLHSLVQDWPKDAKPTCELYDGDTPQEKRRQIRTHPPNILISNPEMLHLGILPWHTQWTTFLSNLRFIVIDEAHTYRGVFGSHMALVFRRLNRIVLRYGLEPLYILCTATLGNPKELAIKLIDAKPDNLPVVIDNSGAPQGTRHFFFLNPLLSPASLAIQLLILALENDLRTIVYCKSRKMTELISIWASSAEGAKYRAKISAYRAGFLPEERREIERQMSAGDLLAVVTTSALELGIDIGGLDVCILVGYPGSVMSTLQRGGRVGRAKQDSCVFMIAGEDALDQYFANNPADFFNRKPEQAVLNPDNEIILARHLECAAAEYNLQKNERLLKTPAAKTAIQSLQAQGLLKLSQDNNYYIALRKAPQRDISLRGTGKQVTIEDQDGKLIGSLDIYRALREVHPGALYIHHGQTYIIQSLDQDLGQVKAKADTVSYFTKPRGHKTTLILCEEERQSLGRLLVCRGRLQITEQLTAYEKRSNYNQQLLAVINLDLEPQIFVTEGLWYIIPDALRKKVEDEFLHFMGSIHALEHAIIGLLPLRVMADRNDFGGISIPLHEQVGLACIFIYDGVPYGAGLTREAFKDAKQILKDTLQAISACKCSDGCPSCVHSPRCGSGNRPISKAGAIFLLNELLQAGTEGDELYTNLSIDIANATDEVNNTLPPLATNQLAPPKLPPKEPVAISVTNLAAISSAKVVKQEYVHKQPPAYYIVFDVETRRSAAEVGGWQNAKRMGVSVVVAYDSLADCYVHYEQNDLDQLFQRFLACDLIIGFNSLQFDYKVLQPFTDIDLAHLPSLDILQVVKQNLHYRLSLDCLAKATLNAQKSSTGLQALKWWKEGKISEIATYCEDDVKLTKDLYLYGLSYGYLFYTNKYGQKVKVQVDF